MPCGNPANPDDRVYAAGFPVGRITAISSADDNVLDRSGNLWIATDGQAGTLRPNDAVHVVAVPDGQSPARPAGFAVWSSGPGQPVTGR